MSGILVSEKSETNNWQGFDKVFREILGRYSDLSDSLKRASHIIEESQQRNFRFCHLSQKVGTIAIDACFSVSAKLTATDGKHRTVRLSCHFKRQPQLNILKI